MSSSPTRPVPVSPEVRLPGRPALPSGASPRRLSPPLPAAALGALVGLPHEGIVPAGLELLDKIHGGLGWAVFRVESGLALPSDPDGMEPPEEGAALQPEFALPGAAPRERFLHAAPDLLLRACEPVAREAAEKGEPLLGESSLAGGRCLVMALPCYEGGRLAAVLCRVQDPSQRGEALPLAALQATGLLRQVASVRAESHRIRSRFGKVAAFVELLGSSAGGLDFAECARRLANHLRETLGCETVALSLRDWRGHRLAAVSGEAGPAEGHSPGRRGLLAHLSEALDQGRPLLYRRGGGEGDGPAAAPVALGLREWFDPAVSLCLPLVDGEGREHGAWLFLWKDEPADFAERRALVEAATPEVAPLLRLLHRGKPGPMLGAILRLWRRGSPTARRVWTGLGIAALVALLLPLPYPVRATCELQPVVRRVIAAPFDGILLRSAARAGEVVREGQLLAEMDGRELRSQLAEAVANRERAAKEADQLLSQGRIAESRMAALEAEGLAHQIELLDYRRRHLEVRSPIDGILLQGDLERSEGAPLRVGDPLFEVGPLERLVAEVAVPAADVSLVRPGAKATLKLESHANGVVRSEILRVAPKSEWREDRNVFLCEAEVANADGELRAGLKGKAKVEGPRRPLLWIWGRDAWLALRYRLW